MSTNDKQLTKNQRLAFLLRKTVADFIATEVKDERHTIMDDLLTRFQEDGIKQLSINLPDGEAIATLTLTQPKPVAKVKQAEADELLAWVARRHPELVEEIPEQVIPAHQALKSDAVPYLIRHTKVVEGHHYTEEGEAVPALFTTTADPSSFSVKYSSGDDSRARLLDAWRDGELAGLNTGTTLPALTWTGVSS
ncbi:hypothetical protein [Nesterenkonia jeotgali]|uniref:Uncharacterized protein n=1 Tax=Nesterenkonia jeotgali TaxID=317018 RepID=A0A0W8IG61_9MICC|nr:hypothetical protein [Nesterenkonia jeotgali]KUG58948.1 hypothetical protein AVL63_02695 [Nesterenkonia jeotgali]